MKVRTVRLSPETNRIIEQRAAQKGVTASDIIRETLNSEFAHHEDTAGEWVLRVAQQLAKGRRDEAFSEAYAKRHA